MVTRNRDLGGRAGQRGSSLGSALAYYLLVGLVGAALAAWLVLATVEALLSGYCDPDATCLSVPSLVVAAIALVVGATLLATAWRIRRDPPRLGPLVFLGAALGVTVPTLPILFILGMSDSLRTDIVSSRDLGPILILTVLLLWAAHSGIAVWRETKREASHRSAGPERTLPER